MRAQGNTYREHIQGDAGGAGNPWVQQWYPLLTATKVNETVVNVCRKFIVGWRVGGERFLLPFLFHFLVLLRAANFATFSPLRAPTVSVDTLCSDGCPSSSIAEEPETLSATASSNMLLNESNSAATSSSARTCGGRRGNSDTQAN